MTERNFCGDSEVGVNALAFVSSLFGSSLSLPSLPFSLMLNSTGSGLGCILYESFCFGLVAATGTAVEVGGGFVARGLAGGCTGSGDPKTKILGPSFLAAAGLTSFC